MYRILQGNVGAVADATYKAGMALKRGMLVVKSTDGTVAPTTTTAGVDKDVFFVNKEFITTGEYGDVDLPDYDDKFEKVASGELVTLDKPLVAGEYFTDQVTGTFTKGKYALVGSDGKLFATNTAGKFIVKETQYSDCGKTATGVVFEVLD